MVFLYFISLFYLWELIDVTGWISKDYPLWVYYDLSRWINLLQEVILNNNMYSIHACTPLCFLRLFPFNITLIYKVLINIFFTLCPTISHSKCNSIFPIICFNYMHLFSFIFEAALQIFYIFIMINKNLIIESSSHKNRYYMQC